MQRARRHQRVSAGLAFALLALVAELAGRSLTHRLDFGRHVAAPSYSGADYYPFLLAGVKLGVALLHKSEIRKLFGFASIKGNALIPL
jgi:hypothetical protein